MWREENIHGLSCLGTASRFFKDTFYFIFRMKSVKLVLLPAQGDSWDKWTATCHRSTKWLGTPASSSVPLQSVPIWSHLKPAAQRQTSIVGPPFWKHNSCLQSYGCPWERRKRLGMGGESLLSEWRKETWGRGALQGLYPIPWDIPDFRLSLAPDKTHHASQNPCTIGPST